MSWYALFVETGKEEMVRNAIYMKLAPSVIRCVIPKRKIPEKRNGIIIDTVKVMFPGYLLICTDMNFYTYYTITETPGIFKLLKYHYSEQTPSLNKAALTQYQENQYFKEIPYYEINAILNLLNNNEILDYSKLLMENSKLTVENGPLKGRESLIKKIDKRKKRAKILIQLGEREMLLDVGVEIFEKEI